MDVADRTAGRERESRIISLIVEELERDKNIDGATLLNRVAGNYSSSEPLDLDLYKKILKKRPEFGRYAV